jgi:hypothetical protein
MRAVLSVLASSAALLVAGRAAATHDQPPPTTTQYLQYGVALTTETAASAGDVCPAQSRAPCILGSGGGLAIRVGYRTRSAWYVGGAYEFSRQDSSNLLRLAILQQLRGETRHYFDYGTRLTPYAAAALGAVLYGNEWGRETGGVTGGLGAGLEFQVTESTLIGIAVMYRPLLFRGWTDSAGQRRADRYLGFGLAHFVAIELNLAIRDALDRW